jgi:hypothetical protein
MMTEKSAARMIKFILSAQSDRFNKALLSIAERASSGAVTVGYATSKIAMLYQLARLQQAGIKTPAIPGE